MSNHIQVIEGDILAMEKTFTQVNASPEKIVFRREAEFALQVLSKNEFALKTAMSNRQSVQDAITNVAAIGISLNPAKKQAYLVPRKGQVCLDISYMGLIDLAVDSGSIKWAQASVVHANDDFILHGIDKAPEHKFSPFATAEQRGPIVGAYVTVKTADGEDYLTHTMSIADVHRIRDRSESWKRGKGGPWVTDEVEMIKKTVVKQASKYWPRATEERLSKAIEHLNTELGEGIDFSSEAEIVSPEGIDIGKAVDRINASTNFEELAKVRAEWFNLCREAKDRVAYKAIDTATRRRRDELQKPQPTEGEANE